MKTVALILALSSAALTQQHSSGNPAQQIPKDNWERMKDCSAQADKWAKKFKAERADKGGEWEIRTTDISYSSHYSPKYERCYVSVFYWTTNPMPSVSGKKDLHFLWHELFDAFENERLATFSNNEDDEKPYKEGCYVRGKGLSVPCAEMQKYFDDHWKN